MKFSDTDKRMMRFALDEARIAFDMGEIPVGAVVARGDTALARAHNERETKKDPCAHAEITAIKLAARVLGDWRLNGLTLYATLEPCPMCAGAIQLCGISRLVYAASDARMGCAGSVYRLTEDPAFPHFCPADGGLFADEAASLLRDFFRAQRSTNHLSEK